MPGGHVLNMNLMRWYHRSGTDDVFRPSRYICLMSMSRKEKVFDRPRRPDLLCLDVWVFTSSCRVTCHSLK